MTTFTIPHYYSSGVSTNEFAKPQGTTDSGSNIGFWKRHKATLISVGIGAVAGGALGVLLVLTLGVSVVAIPLMGILGGMICMTDRPKSEPKRKLLMQLPEPTAFDRFSDNLVLKVRFHDITWAEKTSLEVFAANLTASSEMPELEKQHIHDATLAIAESIRTSRDNDITVALVIHNVTKLIDASTTKDADSICKAIKAVSTTHSSILSYLVGQTIKKTKGQHLTHKVAKFIEMRLSLQQKTRRRRA